MKKYFLLSFSFIEGAAILCFQVTAGCFFAPYFGSTLQSWAMVITATFIGFAAGYFLVGKLFASPKSSPKERTSVWGKYSDHFFSLLLRGSWRGLFFYQLFFSGAYICLASVFFSDIAVGFISITPPFGVLFAALLLIPIPVALLSAIPIIVSQKLAEEYPAKPGDVSAGISSGLSFFISTVGGIAATFFTGFYLIPEFGTQTAFISLGIILLLISLPLIIFYSRMLRKVFFLAAGITIIVIVIINRNQDVILKNQKIIYTSDGILGQLIVADDTLANSRILYLNGGPQAIVNRNDFTTTYGYVQDIIKHTDSASNHPSVLVLGLGGGYLAKHFIDKGCRVDIVELDKRIASVAVTYFNLKNENANIYIDDARHFINAAENKKYDVIVVDVYTGDNAPFHIITIEAFLQMKNLLNDKGLLCVYFPIGMEENIKKAYSMMIHTMNDAGFEVTENLSFANKTMVYGTKSDENNLDYRLEVSELFYDNYPQLELLLAHQNKIMNSYRKNLWGKPKEKK